MTLELEEHNLISLNEHQKEMKKLLLSFLEGQGEPSQNLPEVKLMGMSYSVPEASFKMSYYVGADWIDQKKNISMVVRPKIKGIDFQTMLMKCFQKPKASDNIEKIFYIRTEDQPIEINTRDFQLEALLLVYFLNLMQKIVHKGLRQDYYFIEEKLNGKIKGKILMNRYVTQGIAKERKDQVDCRYQEYGVNCMDNRVLKAALLVCKGIIQRNQQQLGRHLTSLENMYANAIVAFQQVDSSITLQDLHRIHVHPMFKEYRQIMPIAKMIIRNQGYAVGGTHSEDMQMFPPFIIDMPILFERYIYALLLERYGDKCLKYQLATYGNILDFGKLDEKLIMDTKYIPKWEERIDHDNAHQLSGYARNTRIRKHFNIYDSEQILPCLIIYPGRDGIQDFSACSDILFDSDLPQLQSIPDYVKFKKISVRLPELPPHQ